MTEEELKLLDGYLENSLSEAERLAVEERLRTEADLQAKLQELRTLRDGLVQYGRKQTLEKLRELEATQPEIEKSVWQNRWLQMAAAVSVLAVASFLLWPAKNTSIYSASYFEPYPNVVMPSVRGVASQDSTIKHQAYRAYDLGDYKKAVALFEALEKPDEGVLLYLGNSYLAMGDAKHAMNAFQQLTVNYDVFDEQAEWYIAVCYLKLENRPEAIRMLGQIASKTGTYQERAETILKKLN